MSLRFLCGRALAAVCALSLCLPLAPVSAQERLPELGDPAAEGLSVGAERRLGEQIMREIRNDPDYLDDPVLLEYLMTLWQPLLAASRSLGNITSEIDERFAWEAFLVRDRQVNAFALPGGYVGVNLGLISLTGTRDELASVLAHEMSHVTQRHIARSIANSKRQSLIGLASMILGVLAAAHSNRADGANAIFTGGQAVAIQGQLNFSRDVEREADRIGFAVLVKAGFAPGGMAAMFEKLEQASHLNDSGGFPYLRTHPLTSERIGEARSRMGTTPPARPVSVLAHTAAQARARVMMDTRAESLRRWQAMQPLPDASASDRLMIAYAGALAATLQRDWTRADVFLQQALALVRGSPRSDALAERQVVLLQVQSLLERGEAARADQALAPLLRDNDKTGSRAVLLASAQVALAMPQEGERLKRSADELQTWTTLHPTDGTAWTQLGAAWRELGQGVRAARAEAEARVAVGDLNGALDRLRAGQRMVRPNNPTDFIEASIIESRLRDVEAQRRRRDAEERQG
jgi:predicted Zn-dependent protease